MKIIIFSLLTSLVTLFAIDAIWLSTMSKRFYSPHIGHIMAESPKILPAAIFYLIYTLGITVFVLTPAIQGNFSPTKIFVLGAIFGLVAYATYDLTNHATLKDWPAIVTVVDLFWGALLTGGVSLITVTIVKYFS